MRFIDAALPLLDLGWAVFPISPGGKMPAISKKAGGRGVLDATKDVEQIRAWARRFPHANVGVACGTISNLTVLDFDPKNGSGETIRTLKAAGRSFKPTVAARTPSGGWHLYYLHASEVLNSKSLLGKGIDVRTTGGYVVAPPSRVDGGGIYSWRDAPGLTPLARLPIWAHEALKPKPEAIFASGEGMRNADKALQGLARFVEASVGGERNSSLYWAACRAAQGGYTDEATQHMLAAAAGTTGLSQKEALKTIGSAFKRFGRRI